MRVAIDYFRKLFDTLKQCDLKMQPKGAPISLKLGDITIIDIIHRRGSQRCASDLSQVQEFEKD